MLIVNSEPSFFPSVLLVFFALVLVFLATECRAERPRFSIGIDPNYQLLIADENSSIVTDVKENQFSGPALVLQGIFYNVTALRLQPYDLESSHNNSAGLEGIEGSILFGKYNGGFRIFSGVGYFSEHYTDDDAANPDTTFNGWKGDVGLGWDWNVVTTDLTLSIRENAYSGSSFTGEDEVSLGFSEVVPVMAVGLNVSLQI